MSDQILSAMWERVPRSLPCSRSAATAKRSSVPGRTPGRRPPATCLPAAPAAPAPSLPAGAHASCAAPVSSPSSPSVSSFRLLRSAGSEATVLGDFLLPQTLITGTHSTYTRGQGGERAESSVDCLGADRLPLLLWRQ